MRNGQHQPLACGGQDRLFGSDVQRVSMDAQQPADANVAGLVAHTGAVAQQAA